MKTRHVLIAKTFDKKGKLISVASNNYKKTHPLQAYFAKKVGDPAKVYLHAEIHSIIKAGGKLIHTIEIERNSKKGIPLLAKPCPICQEAIKAYGIKNVIYSGQKQ